MSSEGVQCSIASPMVNIVGRKLSCIVHSIASMRKLKCDEIETVVDNAIEQNHFYDSLRDFYYEICSMKHGEATKKICDSRQSTDKSRTRKRATFGQIVYEQVEFVTFLREKNSPMESNVIGTQGVKTVVAKNISTFRVHTDSGVINGSGSGSDIIVSQEKSRDFLYEILQNHLIREAICCPNGTISDNKCSTVQRNSIEVSCLAENRGSNASAKPIINMSLLNSPPRYTNETLTNGCDRHVTCGKGPPVYRDKIEAHRNFLRLEIERNLLVIQKLRSLLNFLIELNATTNAMARSGRDSVFKNIIISRPFADFIRYKLIPMLKKPKFQVETNKSYGEAEFKELIVSRSQKSSIFTKIQPGKPRKTAATNTFSKTMTQYSPDTYGMGLVEDLKSVLLLSEKYGRLRFESFPKSQSDIVKNDQLYERVEKCEEKIAPLLIRRLKDASIQIVAVARFVASTASFVEFSYQQMFVRQECMDPRGDQNFLRLIKARVSYNPFRKQERNDEYLFEKCINKPCTFISSLVDNASTSANINFGITNDFQAIKNCCTT